MKIADARSLPSQIQRLAALRWLAIGSQALALFVVADELSVSRQLAPMGLIVAALVAFNLFAVWRCRRLWPVTDAEVFSHLCVDVAALTMLLYYAGGATNPFVSLLLVPLTIAAATLPGRYAWGIAGLTLGVYSLLMFTHVHLSAPQGLPRFIDEVFPALASLSLQHAAHTGSFSLHLLGMWVNFLVSALIIAFFVVRMATALRKRSTDLALARENALRSEQVLGLGTFAAGAAHQLGTPLSTMAVVIGELERQQRKDDALNADLALLREQIEHCKKILSEMLGAVGQIRGEGGTAKRLDAYLQDVIAQWQLIRPCVEVATAVEGVQPAPHVLTDRTLEQALINLLNNAADASPRGVEVHAQWDASTCHIDILDRGVGIAAPVQNLGQPFFTTKTAKGGIGIGLFLSNAALERYGGKAELFNREGGGACTRITLPLAQLLVEL